HTAIGIYDGPLVAISGNEELLRVRPERVVVATGAVERHGVFEGNDLPGVWLGRGAARLAGVHGVRPGRRAVVVAETAEGLDHARTLLEAGADVALIAPAELATLAPESAYVIPNATVVSARGSKRVTGVEILDDGESRRLRCDA